MNKEKKEKLRHVGTSQIIMGIVIVLLMSNIAIMLKEGNARDENDDIFLTEYRNLLNDGDFQGAISILNDEVSNTTQLKANSHVEALIHYLREDITKKNKEYKEIVELAKGHNVNYDNMDSFFKSLNEESIVNKYNYLRNTFRIIKIPKGEDGVNFLSYMEMDYSKMIEVYGKYLSDDLNALMNLENEEFVYLGTTTSNEINYDKTLSNILLLEEFVLSYPKSIYFEGVKDNLIYHYQTYLGENNWGNIFINNSLSSNAKKHYSQTIELYPESMIAEKLVIYMEALKSEEYKKTPNIEVLLLDLISTDMPSSQGNDIIK